MSGGRMNQAGGNYSFAIGRRAKVRNSDDGTFVWADHTDADFESTGPDQFLIRASGNVGINTSAPGATLDIAGNIRIDDATASPGYVLTALDATGLASWGPAGGGGSDGDWELGTLSNDDVLFTKGNWGIARFGTSLLGTNDFTHVNLGVSSSTGSTADNPQYVTIGGGYSNTAEGEASTISGGYINKAYGHFSAIAGGYQNLIGAPRPPAAVDSGRMSFIGAGYRNYIEGKGSVIGGGSCDSIFDTHCFIGGGGYNVAGSNDLNISNTCYITIGGGQHNVASAHRTTIGGGRGNEALNNAATIGGGRWNTAEGVSSTISGGDTNRVYYQAEWGTVGGGMSNIVSDTAGTIAGGSENTAIAPWSCIGGGRNNQTGGHYSAIPGGKDNITDGLYSLAAGYQAEAYHDGSFVWADATGGSFASTANNQYLIRASGGVGINTNNPAYALDVNGDINVAGSYNVKKGGTNYSHPDYVFEPDYTLMPLDELREYVFTHKHLPNVISADEVKQNDGFKLDELLIQMLEKIEEQTLYILQLEQEKASAQILNDKADEINELKTENEIIKAQLSQLTVLVETVLAKQGNIDNSSKLASK